MKPLLGLLCLFASFSAFAQTVTPIELTLTPDAPDSATSTVPIHAAIANTGNDALGQVGITVHSFDGGELSIPDPAWTCTGTGSGYLQCEHGAVAAQSTLDVDVRVRFPFGAGRARVRVYVDWSPNSFGVRRYGDQEDTVVTLFRRFTVTSAGDAGEGTLRNAILALNSDTACTVGPCRIEFAIPNIAAGSWATITPATPLPSIMAPFVEVDATTQPDTNPLGPDVALVGTNTAGDGLDIRSIAYAPGVDDRPQMAVRGLSIGGFPGNGIYYLPTFNGSGFIIEKNYIGTDPTGTQVLLNLGRGITIGEGNVTGVFVKQGFFDPSEIRDNVLSGNYRSGIYLAPNARGLPIEPILAIRRNRIGVAAASDEPVPNYASGIFVGPQALQVLIEDNVIGHNAHFGIAVAHGATYTRIGANRIFDHPLPGIDRGLDGPANPRFLAELHSATYDAATDTTTIVVHSPWDGGGFAPSEFLFYANADVDADGFAEAEQFLGKAFVVAGGTATLTTQGDLRGKYVSATGTFVYWDFSPFYESSEILRAIRVE